MNSANRYTLRRNAASSAEELIIWIGLDVVYIVAEGDDTLIDLHSSPSEISNHSTCLLDELTQSTSNASLLPLFDQILPEETKNAASQIPVSLDIF